MSRKNVVKIIVFILFFMIEISDIYAVVDEEKIHSSNVGVYNIEDMSLIYGKNIDERISIASITKVMTAIVAVENVEDVYNSVKIDYNQISKWLYEELSIAGIYDGQELTYYDLIATMLIPSGADSAIFIASNIFKNYNEFINKMNEKASELGMNSTHFSNPVGYDDENNYSTIEDVAIMMNYALKNNTLKDILTMKKYTTSDNKLTVYSTLDSLAIKYGVQIDKIIGGKTGTTQNAGRCLASFSDDEGVPLLVIVVGSPLYSNMPYNLIDTAYLYDIIQKEYSKRYIFVKGDKVFKIPTLYTTKKYVDIEVPEDVMVYTDKIEQKDIKVQYEGISLIDSSIKSGEKLGKLSIKYREKNIYESDVLLDESLEFSITKWIKTEYSTITWILGISLILISISLRLDEKKSLAN